MEDGMQPGAQPADLYHDVREALRQALRETLARVAEEEGLERLVQELLRTRDARLAPARAPVELLTAREEQILGRIAAGHSNKAIARTLDLSPHTIKRHVANILAKLGVSSRIQAASWLYEREVPSGKSEC
jgi:DNA-binding NarL/FixJ family response regulator